MVSISKFGDSAIKFTFDDSDHYLMGDGEITVPVNGLILVLDESDMATFKKIDGDPFISFNIADSNFSSKSDLETFYKENMVGSTGGGGGVTSGEVQTMIDESISGKADTSDVQNVASDVATVSGDVNTLSGSVESNHNAITALNGDVSSLSGDVANKADTTAVTASINAAVSGKMDTSAFNTYSASTDARLSEDEEVTSAALNELNDALDDKADTTAVTASIAAAVSGKQDTLIAGTNITISGNVISAEGGGGSINVVQTTGSSSADVMSQSAVTSNMALKSKAVGSYQFGETSGVKYLQFKNISNTNIENPIYYPKINNKGILTSNATWAQNNYNFQLVETSAYTAYTASTDARLAEDEEVTAAALNSLNDALSDKADTSAVTESINAAVSGKADTSAFTAHTADTTIHTTSAEKASWNGAVTALGGLKLVSLTQAQYDALATKDASTLYIITNVVN